MKFNELTAPRQTAPKRVGRGISAGGGKTAGRGTKGQGARKSSTKAGFEGGQMPIYMRLPKLRGFKSKRDVVETVSVSQIDAIKPAIVDTGVLAEAGLISNAHVAVKLIGSDSMKSKKTVKLFRASKSAIKSLEAAGGKFEQTDRLARVSSKKDK